jgi:hypothetical protein
MAKFFVSELIRANLANSTKYMAKFCFDFRSELSGSINLLFGQVDAEN